MRQEGEETPHSNPSSGTRHGLGSMLSQARTCSRSVAAFPVDTHIHRLAERWGLSSGKSVEQTEADLKAVFEQARWNKLHLQLIWFGRQHCPAKGHDPQACPICSWGAGKKGL